MEEKAAADPAGRALALLRDLIRCPSVTPKSAGSLELVEGELAAAGFSLERMDAGDVSNLWATHGEGRPVFAFVGHLDVVPPGDGSAWSSDPFTPVERDGRMYGRGATDMKGGVAAMVVAATEHARKHPDHGGTIAVVLTTDEEGPAVDGVRHMVEVLKERGESLDFALVCEPSGDRVFGDTLRIGRRGSLTGTIEVEGVQGHVAYPDRVDNPVPSLARICAKVSELQFDSRGEGEERTTVQVVRLSADGGADNVVPGTASAKVNFRHHPLDSPEGLRGLVEGICAAEGGSAKCSWGEASKPYRTDPDCDLVRTLCEACVEHNSLRPKLSAGGGTSDGRFVADVCGQVVEFGTTGLTMHMVDENVEASEIDALLRVYSSCLGRLLDAGRGA